MSVDKLIRDAYNQGFTDDAYNLPECAGTVDPETNQQFNCGECPLNPHCTDLYAGWLWR